MESNLKDDVEPKDVESEKKRIRTYKMCEHGKRVSRCATCGGSELCEQHKRLKNQCKECKGGSICEHNRIRSGCKECKGGNICEHNKVRGRCKECGSGTQFCEHGVYKLSCVPCHGTLICEHKKRRNVCAECNGSSMCIHNKIKYYCLDCQGAQICEHKIPRSRCYDCNGGSICEHGKIRCRCVDCGGSQICMHGMNKQSCVPCGGSQRCIHGKYTKMCRECGGNILCKSEWCETVVHHKKYNGYCLRCCVHLFPDIPVSRNYKTKEKAVVDELQLTFSDVEPEKRGGSLKDGSLKWVYDKRISGGSSLRRPDLFLDLETQCIIVEVDENKHSGYDCECENRRLMELSRDVLHRPIVFIRFNPDGFTDKNGRYIESCWKMNKLGVLSLQNQDEWNRRIHILKEQILYWIQNTTEKTIEIIELFY